MRMLTKDETAAHIESNPHVISAPVSEYVHGHESTTSMHTKGGWRKFLSTRYVYAVSDSGIVIEFERTPTIDNEIWYDDTGSSPLDGDASHDHDVFIGHNARNFDDRGLSANEALKADLDECGSCAGKYQPNAFMVEWPDNPYTDACCMFREPDARVYSGAVVHKLSDKETSELAEIISRLKERYDKRLESYWRRYGKTKVFAIPYWADR